MPPQLAVVTAPARPRVHRLRSRRPFALYRQTKKINGRLVEVGNWWVRFTAPGPDGLKQQHRINLDTDDNATADLKAAQVYAEHMSNPPLRTSNPLLVPFLEEYLCHAAATKAKRTVATEKSFINHFLDCAVPNRDTARLGDITTHQISNYLVMRRKRDGISNRTWCHIRLVLHGMFTYARRVHGFADNPAHDVAKPPISKKPICYLKLADIRDVLDAIRKDALALLPVVATAILAGPRRSEIVWLTWADVDLDRKLFIVRPKTVGGESYVPKTNKERLVPISDDLLPYIKPLKRGSETDWVFPSPKGCRWNEDNLSKRLAAVMKKRKWTWSFNVFRHTFGSMLAQKGLSLYKISTLMGNSEKVCRDHYAALAVEDLQPDISFMGGQK